MRRISKKSRVAIAGAIVVAVAGGGVAYGYWSTNGTGADRATTASGASQVTITQTAAPTDLAPGMPASSIAGTVQNPANHAMYVHRVTVTISSVTLAPNAPGACDAGDYTLSNAVMAVNTDLAGGASADFGGATLGFNDKPTENQDGCKGAVVHLAYDAS
jgi:hypothetical protein